MSADLARIRDNADRWRRERRNLAAAVETWETWLEAGRWPSGAELTAEDRRLIGQSVARIREVLGEP